MNIIKNIDKELRGKSLDISMLSKESTALITIDMINGFVYEGALSSPRVTSIVDNIVELNDKTIGYKKVFFMDSHDACSMEFMNFPKHCIKNTKESEIINELKVYTVHENVVCIEKNSTNGFNNIKFREWLSHNIEETDNFIIVGCVTDICIMQFALSLKAYINENNLSKKVIVPINCVNTYDLGTHDGELMNVFALYNMNISGIEVIDKII